jgi:hypothetical protein
MRMPALPTSISDDLRPAVCSRALSPSRLVFFFAIVLAAFTFVSAPAGAQDPAPSGTLTVEVRDHRGPAAAALVRVTHAASDLSRLVRTGPDGRTTLTALPPGEYNIHLPASDPLGALHARVIASSADIQTKVHGLVRLDGPETYWMRTSFMAEELSELPLNQFRNVQSLVILRPGALPPTFANAENDTPQRSLTLRLNGQSGPQVHTRLDDQTNVNLWLPSHLAYVPPIEAIDTLSVPGGHETWDRFSAGASFAVRLKSGANDISGSAFEFFSNDALTATPFRSRRLPMERHTVGGTLGGPFVRDRVFAFGSYEGYFSRAQAQRFYTVPDERLRHGDLSQALNGSGSLQRIYDPLTPGADTATGTGRQRISYVGPPACAACATGLNVFDPARIHPIARRVLELYPLPNRPGGGRAGLSNNFSRVESTATNRHNADIKLRYHPTGAWDVWGRLSQMYAVVDDRWVFPIDPVDEDGGVTKVRQLAGGVTWVFSPSITLHGSIGVTTLDQQVNSSDSFLGQYGLDVLGIPGTNHQGRADLPLAERYQGLPSFATGFSTIGTTPTWAPQTRNERTVSAQFQLTRFFGSQELTAGYALNHFALDHWQPERQNPRGAFHFASNATRHGGSDQQSANSYNTYAAFLLGLVGSAGKSIQPELFTTRESQHALFVHYSWSPRTHDLTLDTGLQWDYFPVMMRKGRGPEMTDLGTLEVLVGGRGGLSENLGLSSPTDNFAPRLGLTWRTGLTMWRARYSLFFDSLAWARPFRGDASYPNAINARFLPPAHQQPFGWFATLDQGIPLIPLPDPNASRLSLPAFISDQRTLEPDTLERPRVHSWSVAVERALPHQLQAEVAYVGNTGIDGWADININAVQHLGGGAGDRPYNVAPFFTTQPITVFRRYTDREYHALQVSVHRYLRDGLTLRSAYTISQSMIRGREYELPAFADRNWHPSSDDRTHMLALGFVWELPWRTERGFTGAAGWLLNDWQLNGILTAFSGAPFTVRADATELNTPGNVQTADLVGPVVRLGDIGGDGFFYDPSAFAEPTGQRLGETTINQFRGPGGANLDLSVFRNLQLPGGRRLQFRLEALNVTNTPKYGNPDGNLSSSTFMRVFSLNDAYTERQIRLAARYAF